MTPYVRWLRRADFGDVWWGLPGGSIKRDT